MDDLTSLPGIAAIAAAAIALAALLACLMIARRLSALRAAQRVVLGDSSRDLVGHAEALERRLIDLGRRVEESVGELARGDTELSLRLDGAITHCGVVRYDAMGEMTGRQSSSVALLDSFRSGVVLSSILHREQARLYAKQIVSGSSEFELSPEEQEALKRALSDHSQR